MLNLTQNENIDLIQSLILLVFIGASLIVHVRSNPGAALRNISLWIIVLFVAVFAYSFRHEAENIKTRIAGELFPSSAISNQDGSISFRAASDGHYHINTKIHGVNITFMVDTGASDVVLTKKDAKKIGVNLQNLDYTKMYNTANGTTYAAPIIIKELIIDNIAVYNIKASVNNAEMEQSLLGMSFLEKLHGYEVRDGILTLWVK